MQGARKCEHNIFALLVCQRFAGAEWWRLGWWHGYGGRGVVGRRSPTEWGDGRKMFHI